MWSIAFGVLLLAGISLALPTPGSEEKEGDVSRKILGSSVVTSVSVIMDVGNGSQTYFSDAVGKPMNKPATATQLASPINLLNPDRYEFYTFDDSGDLVKRLMTLDEIQGIIASGDGEASNYNSQSLTGDMPEKRVDDVVNNVQNVLKEEMEAHKTLPELKPAFDTPDITSTWNMILPAIFGNSGDNIVPGNLQNGATPETIMIEPTTLLPLINDTMVVTNTTQADVTPTISTENAKQSTTLATTLIDSASESMIQESKTESIDGADTPIIAVEITTVNKQNISTEISEDEAPLSSKTEPANVTVMPPTTENLKVTQYILETQTNAVQTTPAKDSLKLASVTSTSEQPESSPASLPTTIKLEEIASSTRIPSLSTIAKVTFNNKDTSSTTPLALTPTLLELDASSTTHFYKKTEAPRPFTRPQSTTNKPSTYKVSTPVGQLSTFFLIGDFKNRPESTTGVYLRPSPFTVANTDITKTTTNQSASKEKPETTTKSFSYSSPLILSNTGISKVNTVENHPFKTTYPTTEMYSSTMEENPAKEDTKGHLQLDIQNDLNMSSTIKTSSTEEATTKTTDYSPELSTTELLDLTSTPEITTVTTNVYLETSTTQTIPENHSNLQFSTTEDSFTQQSTTEMGNEDVDEKTSHDFITTQSGQKEEVTEPTTTESATYTEKPAVTELLNQLLLTTNIEQINSELLNSATTLETNPPTTENNLATVSIRNESVAFIDISTTEDNLGISISDHVNKTTQNSTLQPEESSTTTTTDGNLVSSIEQLISQAVGNLEEPVDNIKESEQINQLVLNANSKPMSDVQVETATAASALIGAVQTEAAPESTLIDAEVNQAVDSLISQIIYQPSQTTIEEYSTTERADKYTTENAITSTSRNIDNLPSTTSNPNELTTTLNIDDDNGNSVLDTLDDDRNRYEEIDLERVDLPTVVNYEAKTERLPLINYTENENLDQLNVTDKVTSNNLPNEDSIVNTSTTELSQKETKYPSTVYTETYSTTQTSIQDTATFQYIEDPSQSLVGTSTISDLNTQVPYNTNTDHGNVSDITTEEIVSSTEGLTEGTSKSNEILNTEATELQKQNYNGSTENSSEPFLILAVASSEYPDYTSTENMDSSTKSIEYGSTTSGEVADSTTSGEVTGSTTSGEVTGSTTSGEVTENTETITELQTTFTTQADLSTEENLIENAASATEELNVQTTEIETISTTTSKPNTQVVFNNTLLALLSTEKINLTSELPSTTAPSTPIAAATNSQATQAFVNIATVTVAPKIEKPAELKLIINSNSSSTTSKPDMTWTLVSTVVPHKTTISDESTRPTSQHAPDTSVDLVPKPLQGFGLEDSTSSLDTDVFQFTELCNELAFSFWSSVTSGISFARSVIVSPFAATSMLAMVFLGARGSTSGEMNEILKLDDMVTFNPHAIFKNVIESIEVSKKSGVATSVFVKELYSDKNKGKLLNFYKERVKQFYDGHVEEINFREINDVIRRRTNLLVKRQTWGKIQEYLKDNTLFVRPPLAAVSANIFQTDCSTAFTEGRDGELHFVVLPSIRQRKLIPIPAVVWRSGFLAGYDPGLDATAVAIGGKDQTISTIFVIPGQQGISAPGDGLVRLEARLIDSAFRQGAWSRLLRSLIPRPGLEVQIPRFSHKSVINATSALQRMGLKDLFNSNTADLKGLNGVAHELYLSDIVQVNTFATCGEGRIDETHHSEVYPATTNRSFRRIRKIHHYHIDKPFENSDLLEEPRDYQRAFHDPLYDPSFLALPLQLRPRQARLPDAPRLRFDRPFLYLVRHNPTGLILHMGRFNPRLLP